MNGPLLHASANAFGFKRVVRDEARSHHVLFHDDTEHGRQAVDPALALEPLGYYARGGAVDAVFTVLAPDAPVGVIGLGVGGMAAYARPGQRFVFFEIDAEVVDIARNEGLFTYLARSPGRCEVVVGDGLAGVTASPSSTFGLVFLDAFEGGVVPASLVSGQAIFTYLDRLRPDGVLAIHATTVADTLTGPLRGFAAAKGLAFRTRVDVADQDGDTDEVHIVVLARSEATLAAVDADVRWTR